MANKPGLGRGLGALIPDSLPGLQEIGTGQNAPMSVPPGRLRPNPKQPRKDFKEEALAELADSIREHGLIQPILVEESGPGEYLIVAGERRWRAAQIAGLREVPVIVKAYTEQQRLEIALIENIQREDLNPLEEANAYHNLMEMTGLAQEEVARRVGKNRSTIANALRLLKLPDEVLGGLRDGQISAGHARSILSVINPADQLVLFHRILTDGYSVRRAEDVARELNQGKRAAQTKEKAPKAPPAVELRELEQRLIERLGTKVSFSGTPNKGRIIVEYYSQEDLERILDKISGNV